MTKEELRMVYDTRFLTMFADMVDLHASNVEESIKKAGRLYNGKVKTKITAFRHSASALRRLFYMQHDTEEENLKEADSLSQDVDKLYAFNLLLLDRCKDNDKDIYDLIKEKYPSVLNYDLGDSEKSAFE